MRRRLRILRRMVAIDLSVALTYRGEFVIYMVGLMVTPVVSLLVWRAALAGGVDLPVSREYVTTYFVLLGVVAMLTSSWIAGFLADEIRLGKLSAKLVRPASTHYNGIANNISEKLVKIVALTPMIGVLWWVFRDAVVLPGDPVRWLLFAVSIALSAVMAYAIDVMMGALAFWFDDVKGLISARVLIIDVLSGYVVPLALMPEWAQGVMRAQPFRFLASFPLEIVVGGLDGRALATGFALQVGYVGLFVGGAAAVWRAGLRSYSAVGA